MHPKEHVLKVWGDLGCFTRPELKVERFSYPVITPSAARGIFDSIYCKPSKFRWQIKKVEVLRPIKFIALRRNEVKSIVSTRNVKMWTKDPKKITPYYADEDRTQRQTIALKKPCFRITAQVVPWPGSEGQTAAFDAQFKRRAKKGKCIMHPCLGCREFPAFFELVEGNQSEQPVPETLDIGIMLYDVFDLSRPGSSTDAANISVFRAKLNDGVLEVPPYDSEAVLKTKEAKHA